jgi:hypothetical protein
VRVLRPSNEDEMVWVFLRGELDSNRFGPRLRATIDERLLLEPDLGDDAENALRRAALTTLRGVSRAARGSSTPFQTTCAGSG